VHTGQTYTNSSRLSLTLMSPGASVSVTSSRLARAAATSPCCSWKRAANRCIAGLVLQCTCVARCRAPSAAAVSSPAARYRT